MGKAAVTGVKDLSPEGAQRIERFLRGIRKPPEEFTTGAQFGSDTVAAETALALWPRSTKHRIVVPAHRHNNDVVAHLRRAGRNGVDYEVVNMEEGTTYLHRNDRMLDHATFLVAFPKSRVEVQRSGTWHTIRQARKRNLPIILVPLDGDKEWREGPRA